MNIRIPMSLLGEASYLDSNELFTVLCLLCNGQDRSQARWFACGLHAGKNRFRDGFESLLAKNLVDPHGELFGLWGKMISGKQAKIPHNRWGVPAPYRRLIKKNVDKIQAEGLSKTAFMTYVALATGMNLRNIPEFCRASYKAVSVAKGQLKDAGLISNDAEKTKQVKPFTVEGTFDSDRLATLVSEVQASLTFDLAKAEGRSAAESGMYSGDLDDFLPKCYLGYLCFRSKELTDLLDGEDAPERLVGRVPSLYAQGFLQGWNEEQKRRGHEKVADTKFAR